MVVQEKDCMQPITPGEAKRIHNGRAGKRLYAIDYPQEKEIRLKLAFIISEYYPCCSENGISWGKTPALNTSIIL